MLRRLGGATMRRVIDHSDARVPEHAHDWPVLSLYVLGGYVNSVEDGEVAIAAPSAVLYRAGAAHRNVAGDCGFEQIEIEFDPDWIGRRLPDAPVTRWLGGPAASISRRLARACVGNMSEERMQAGIRLLLGRAPTSRSDPQPHWLQYVTERVRRNPAARVHTLAREAGLHPSTLGSAYRRATGEGILDMAARLRLEAAACLLRETDRSCADIALAAGFCDQSHMNRTSQRLLGRTPLQLRADRAILRQAD